MIDTSYSPTPAPPQKRGRERPRKDANQENRATPGSQLISYNQKTHKKAKETGSNSKDNKKLNSS